MPTIGRYAEIEHHPHPWQSRLRWWWTLIDHYRPRRRSSGDGYSLYREWGAWVLRPDSGLRSWRWITPSAHATRSVPGDDRDAAVEWWMDIAGIPG